MHAISTHLQFAVTMVGGRRWWSSYGGGSRVDLSCLIPCGGEKPSIVDQEIVVYMNLYRKSIKRENTWAQIGLFSYKLL